MLQIFFCQGKIFLDINDSMVFIYVFLFSLLREELWSKGFRVRNRSGYTSDDLRKVIKRRNFDDCMHASSISILLPPPQHSCYKNVIPKPAGCNILMLNLALFQHLRAEQVAKISFYSKGLVASILTGMHPKERILSLSCYCSRRD